MISLIIPVYNEEANIALLLAEIATVVYSEKIPIKEIIYIDDGSTDRTHHILTDQLALYPFLRIVRHTVRAGQSAGFWSGAIAARGEVLVLMDGDGQNDPHDIIHLWARYQESGHKAAVMGQRAQRHDTFIRRVSSRMANGIRCALLRDGVRDTGCSLKLIPRQAYLALPYFNHMHRFLPALLLRDDVFVVTTDVSHRARERGVSKYGFWDRLWVGIWDIFGVLWLIQRARPKGLEAIECFK